MAGGDSSLTGHEWTAQFKKTQDILAEEKNKREESDDSKLRKLMFPKQTMPKKQRKRKEHSRQELTVPPAKRKKGKPPPGKTNTRSESNTFSPSGISDESAPAQPKEKGRPHKKIPIQSQQAISETEIPEVNKILPQRSALATVRLHRVRKVHEDGTLQITPCIYCFQAGKQCVKSSGLSSCSCCLQRRKKCEGAVALGKWVEKDDTRV